MLGHTTGMRSSEANVVHFSAEGSEAKRAMVIAGAAGGSVFRGGQRSFSVQAADLFRRRLV